MGIVEDSWLALLMLAFVLGLKHGLDADHLACVDAMTRFNVLRGVRHARWCGVLFSLGHGLTVAAIAALVGELASNHAVPGWLDELGAWVSILFLLALGVLNLSAVVTTPPDHVVHPVGLKSKLFRRLTHASHPAAILVVGMLFALSFDTVSQAAVFSISASGKGGWTFASLLGFSFMCGMMLTDGANGLWVSRLLRAADARARIASRVMGVVVGGLSLLVGLFGVGKYFSAEMAALGDEGALWLGMGVIAFVSLGFAAALRAASPTHITVPKTEKA